MAASQRTPLLRNATWLVGLRRPMRRCFQTVDFAATAAAPLSQNSVFCVPREALNPCYGREFREPPYGLRLECSYEWGRIDVKGASPALASMISRSIVADDYIRVNRS